MVEENFSNDVAKKSGVGKTLAWIFGTFILGFGVMVGIYFMTPISVITLPASSPNTTSIETATSAPVTDIVNDPTLADACRAFVIASGKDVQGSGTDYSSLYTEAGAKTSDIVFNELVTTITSNYVLEIASPEDDKKNRALNKARSDLALYCVKVGAFTETEYWDFVNKAAGIEN